MGQAIRAGSRALCAGLLAFGASTFAQQTTEGWPHIDDWPQFLHGAAHQGRQPYEFQLSRWTVPKLQLLWTGPTGTRSNGGPVVAGGRVFVQNDEGRVFAFAVDCADNGGDCAPLWQSQPPFYGMGTQWGVPAVADGVVYYYADRLYAYDADCGTGGATCSPLWQAWLTNVFYATSPTVKNGVVYVAGSRLYAFDAHCNSGGGSCTPLWQSSNTSTYGMGSPTIAGDEIFVLSAEGDFYAYPLHCPTAECAPTWHAKTDVGFFTWGPNSSAASADGRVYVPGLNGWLYAFPTHCATGGNLCEPLWAARTGGYVMGSPAVAGDTVYVGAYDGLLYAFPTDCSRECRPRWTGRTASSISRSSPAIANGVVYISSWRGSVYAFPAHCGQGGAACTPLWVGDAGAFNDSAPAVSRGVLYTGSLDGRIHAFGLKRQRP